MSEIELEGGRLITKKPLRADEAVMVSIAVSLKRIADTFEKLGAGDIDLSILHNQVTSMAWEAGRSFRNGDGR